MIEKIREVFLCLEWRDKNSNVSQDNSRIQMFGRIVKIVWKDNKGTLIFKRMG